MMCVVVSVMGTHIRFVMPMAFPLTILLYADSLLPPSAITPPTHSTIKLTKAMVHNLTWLMWNGKLCGMGMGHI